MSLRIRRKSPVSVKLASTLIAIFALVVAPMYGVVESRVANAAEPSHSVAVTTEAELLTAAKDKTKTVIHIRDDITLNEKIVLSGRNVNVKGHGHKLTFNGVDDWNGEYVIQAYKNYITVGSLSISGGDAAIYANGATVRILGTVDVSDNEFGGIELSRGGGVTGTPTLNLTEAGAALVNNTEKTGEPTVWVDKVSNPLKGAGSVINGGSFTKTTHIGDDQHQYYLDESSAGIVAVNEDTEETFASLQDAIDDTDTNAGDLITLKSDVVTSEQITVNKSLTIDGSDHTIDGAFAKAGNGNNSVIGVQQDGVTIKKVTVTSSTKEPFPNQLHGINVDSSVDVVLEKVTARDMMGSGILINNGSVASVVDVTTENNGWHGINVDNGSTLNISGTSTHGENSPNPISDFEDGVSVPDIFIDDVSKDSIVNDVSGQYISGQVPFVRKGVTYTAAVYTLGTIAAPTDLKVMQDGADKTNGFVNKRNLVVQWTAPTGVDVDYYNYQAAGAPGKTKDNPYETTVNGTSLSGNIQGADGSREYRVQAVDTSGNVSGWTEWVKVTLDTVTPEVDNLVLNDNAVTDDNLAAGNCHIAAKPILVSDKVKLDAIVTDASPSSGMKYSNFIVRSINDKGCTNGNQVGKSIGGTADTSHLNGLYRVQVRASDKAGNTISKHIDVLFDNTSPDFVVTERPATSILNQSAVVFKGKASDNVGGVGLRERTGKEFVYATVYDQTLGGSKTFYLYVNNGEWTLNTDTINTDGSVTLGDYLVDGNNYKITFKALDKLSNQTNAMQALFTYDNTDPVATLKNVVNIDDSVSVLGTITDKNLSHYWLTISKDGVNLSLSNTNKYVYTDEFTDEVLGTFSEPGVYAVKLDARDKANNKDANLSVAEMTFTIAEPTTGDEKEDVDGAGGGDVDNTDTSGTDESTEEDEQEENPLLDQASRNFISPLAAQGTSVLGLDTEDEGANSPFNTFSQGDQTKVLGAEDENDNTGCFKLLGLCWYWWIPIIVVVAALITWWGVSRRGKQA